MLRYQFFWVTCYTAVYLSFLSSNDVRLKRQVARSGTIPNTTNRYRVRRMNAQLARLDTHMPNSTPHHSTSRVQPFSTQPNPTQDPSSPPLCSAA